MPRPISGKRFAPKIRMMINRMMMSSGTPKPMGWHSITLLRAPRFGEASLWVVGIVLAGGLVSAQFSSGVNLVEVYAAVTDRGGSPVVALTRGDFTVLEDGQAQAVSAFAEGDFPLSVAIAIDRSF